MIITTDDAILAIVASHEDGELIPQSTNAIRQCLEEQYDLSLSRPALFASIQRLRDAGHVHRVGTVSTMKRGRPAGIYVATDLGIQHLTAMLQKKKQGLEMLLDLAQSTADTT